MSELVSIVICAHDNWPDLELTIASALCQSHEAVEVIVVDNSSSDATAIEVPRRFGSRVRFVRQPNRGDAGAYNAGWGFARGEFVQFVDGDDVLAANKVEKQLEVFREHPDTDIVYGDVRFFQCATGPARWIDRTQSDQATGLGPFLDNDGDSIGSVLNVLFHRRALDRVGPWDETQYRCDADFFLRAAAAGCHFRYSPGVPMAFKRVRPRQMGTDAAAMLAGTEALWTKALGYIADPVHGGVVRFNLARVRFHRAVRRDRMTRRRALALARDARRLSPDAISFGAYAAGCMTIVLPGCRVLVTSRRLQRLRRAVVGSLGYVTARGGG